jgi:RNA polymerase sigma factor (sigma-70 family)
MNIPVLPPAQELTLEHLYRSYRMAVFSVCYSYTRSREEANDLVQETFVKAYLGLGGFEGRCHPKTWLLRIAINQSLTRVMANKRGQRRLDAYLENAALEQGQHREDATTSKLGMEEVLKRADATTRKVLLLYFQQGLTHSQIARTLGVSRVAVTRRITRFKEHACQVTGKKPIVARTGLIRKEVKAENWTREPAPYPEASVPRIEELVEAGAVTAAWSP